MPYVSQAQAGYFHTHKAQLEKQGVDVGEWDAATKGKHLPKRAPAHKEGGPVMTKGTGPVEAHYAEGGSVLPRSGDWKKTVPNRGFLNSPDRFTSGRKVQDAPGSQMSSEEWKKTGGAIGNVKPKDKSESPVKPRG